MFGAAALYFLVEVIRRRPFFGSARRSTSLARALVCAGLGIAQIDLPSGTPTWAAVMMPVIGLIFLVGALCIWVWQGWSEGPARPGDRTGRTPTSVSSVPTSRH